MGEVLEQRGQIVRLAVKVVPGSSNDTIVGLLGDRLKVRVASPPEGGKANRAVLSLLARHLRVRPADLAIAQGQSSSEKVVAISGLGIETVRLRLSTWLK